MTTVFTVPSGTNTVIKALPGRKKEGILPSKEEQGTEPYIRALTAHEVFEILRQPQ